MKLNFRYSLEAEADRIGYTLDKYKWFKENNYRINLPNPVRHKADQGEQVTDEEIMDALKLEYNSAEYEQAANNLKSEFGRIQEGFEKNLRTLGGPVHDTYNISITKYGVGGSYGFPNNVQVNIDYGRKISWQTLAHEIVHTAIEGWISEYKIPHWIKERIVDLTMNKFFPGEIEVQRKKNEYPELQKAFDEYFPDIKKVIVEIAHR